MATPLPRVGAPFTLDEVVRATRGAALGVRAIPLTGVSTDTRALDAGMLFVALRGERFDAHDHLGAAVAAGAGALVVERAFADRARALEVPVVAVDDTLRALADLAAFHVDRVRAASPLRTVAVSGAVGKTTTKELLAAALTAAWGEALATRGNLNNLVGAPLTVLTLAPAHRAAVIECGSNAPGEIARIGAMLRPDVAVCMNADVAHTEGVGGIEGVADEEGSLFAHATRAVVGNADEPLSLARMALAAPGVARFTFGVAATASARLAQRVTLPDGRARLSIAIDPSLCAGAGTLAVTTALLGPAVATNFAAALACVAATGADADALRRAADALGAVPPVPGRLCPRTIRDALVLDDTYNASPRAVRAALDAARELADARGARLVVALGDMRELGDLSARCHADAGRDVAAARADVFVACGPEMERAAESATGVGEVLRAATSDEAGALLRDRVRPGDVVLVKGSRGTRMERALAALEG